MKPRWEWDPVLDLVWLMLALSVSLLVLTAVLVVRGSI